MKTGMRAVALGLALLAVAPASADVKAGVDAWSRGEYKMAVDQWRGPAVAGDADAQFNMGQAYKLGRGVPVDLVQAENWYQKAAAQGHIQAQDNYGLALFQNGKRDKALPWLQKSVARGEPRSQYVVGTMLFNGDGVPKDWVRAYALMLRASAAGLPQATQTLGQMDQYISLAERQQGTVLARTYEADAARPTLPPEIAGSTAMQGGMQGADLPPSDVGRPPLRQSVPLLPDRGPGYSGGKATVSAAPLIVPPVVRPAPRPPVEVVRAPARVQGKGWRLQFGAFRDEGNAKALWQSLRGRVSALTGLQPYLVKSGTLTKLQAGPLASSHEATRICAEVRPTGTPCVPVAP